MHGDSGYGRFNAWLAVKITNSVGSMTCAYAFALLTFISLPAAIASHDSLIIVSWIAQTFLQLVLLSVIMVGQRVISVAQDARATTDHEMLNLLHAINVQQLDLIQTIRHYQTQPHD